MKKSILAIFAISMTLFAAGEGEVKKVHDNKTAKLVKDSYCNKPKSHGEFKKINDKDYRVDVDFEKCVFDGEEYENVKELSNKIHEILLLLNDVQVSELNFKRKTNVSKY